MPAAAASARGARGDHKVAPEAATAACGGAAPRAHRQPLPPLKVGATLRVEAIASNPLGQAARPTRWVRPAAVAVQLLEPTAGSQSCRPPASARRPVMRFLDFKSSKSNPLVRVFSLIGKAPICRIGKCWFESNKAR